MKQRLVGAVVLVALAVIFLPMLLDGSGQSGPRDVAIDIPDQPQPPPNRLDQSTNAATDDAAAANRDTTGSSSGGEPQPGTMSEQPVPHTSSGDGAAASNPPAAGNGGAAPSADASEDSARDAAASSATNDAAASAPESSPETDGSAPDDSATAEAASTEADEANSTGWVVQVGSFGRETNALVLRDRLRELGFDTFVERAETDQGAVWRVRVGPVASEDEAKRLSKRVTEERGGPALVMTQP